MMDGRDDGGSLIYDGKNLGPDRAQWPPKVRTVFDLADACRDFCEATAYSWEDPDPAAVAALRSALTAYAECRPKARG